MGIFDDIVGPTTQPSKTSGGLFDDIIGSQPGIEANSAFGLYQSQGVRDYLSEKRKEAVDEISFKKDHSFSGVMGAPKEIWGGIKRGFKETPWNAPEKQPLTLADRMSSGKPFGTVIGGGIEVAKDKWRTLDDRLNAHLQPLTDKWLDPTQEKPSVAEITGALGNSGLEILDNVFAPLTGAIEGASKTPGLSFLGNTIQKIFGTIGGAGGEIVSETLDLIPMTPETRAHLEPSIQGWGAFGAQLGAGYGLGKAIGKAMPTLIETKIKVAEVVDTILRDRLIQNKVAELNAKVRGYETYKEGEPIDWGESQTKAPKTAEEIIDWGDSNIPSALRDKTNEFVSDKELPTFDIETGKYRPVEKPQTEPVKPVLPVSEVPTVPKIPFSAVRAERENYPGKEVQVTTDGVNSPAVIVSSTSKTGVTVRLPDGAEISVPANTIRDIRTNAEVVTAAGKRLAPTPSIQPIEQGVQPAQPTTPRTGIAVETPPPSRTAKPSAEIKGQGVPQAAQPTAARPDVVTVNGATYRLSGDALTKYQQAKMAYDASIARLNTEYARATAGRRQQISGDMKALGMKWSATQRELTGNFTAKEIENQLKTEKTNYKGKKVIVEVNGKKVEGEVIGTAFGKIKVRLKDGTELSVTKDKITDPRSAKDIKDELLKREGVEKYDETKVETPPAEQLPTEQVKPEAPMASPEYNQLLIELEMAERGRIERYGEHDATKENGGITYVGIKSTFPHWLPENAGRKSYIEKYLKDRTGTVEDANIKYKEGSVLDKIDKALRAQEEKLILENQSPIMESTVNGAPVTDITTAAESFMGAGETTGGGGTMRPVSGSGETRTPTASQRILAENLKAEFGEMAQYSRVNWEEQAQLVQDFITRDPNTAWNVAMGRERAPTGMLDTAVWKEFRLRARANGDVDASIQLAKSTIPEALARYGQETGVLSTMDANDPTAVIIDASKQYVKNWEKRNPGKNAENEIKTAVEQIRNSMRENASGRDVYKEIARRLLCK